MRLGAVSLSITFLLAGRAASAEEDRASRLFTEGLDAMDAGRFADACPRIAESQELDPRPGTLFTLAECEWKWNKPVTALGHYEAYIAGFGAMTAEQRTKQGPREVVARAQIKALSAQVARITFAVEPAGTKATLEVDGVAGSGEMAVAPGEHTVVAKTASGQRSQHFSAKAGEKQRVTVNVDAGGLDRSFIERLATRTDRVSLYVAGGVGVAGVIVGGIFGGLALGSKSTVSDHCGIGGDAHACDAKGRSAADSGRTQGWISTAALAIGIAGLVTAVTLWVIAAPDTANIAQSRR